MFRVGCESAHVRRHRRRRRRRRRRIIPSNAIHNYCVCIGPVPRNTDDIVIYHSYARPPKRDLSHVVLLLSHASQSRVPGVLSGDTLLELIIFFNRLTARHRRKSSSRPYIFYANRPLSSSIVSAASYYGRLHVTIVSNVRRVPVRVLDQPGDRMDAIRLQAARQRVGDRGGHQPSAGPTFGQRARDV